MLSKTFVLGAGFSATLTDLIRTKAVTANGSLMIQAGPWSRVTENSSTPLG